MVKTATAVCKKPWYMPSPLLLCSTQCWRYCCSSQTELNICHVLTADKVQAAKRMPGGSLKPKEKASMTPVKLTSSKLKAESSADRHPMQRTINRRQRLQELYEELQALGD